VAAGVEGYSVDHYDATTDRPLPVHTATSSVVTEESCMISVPVQGMLQGKQ
jgi:hypothetical protein